ncbi:hypothetical protein OGATHE_006771 [Ogataea polymorpha]|uniref:Uncharacterized protein n=1 Tax=Ogataea polymorpha TaxID=460523 RepID=A0A9P8SYQ3_9ASCO|nr:hypothetical protein OGATHE_006771 [Ogataea polymorpha]
MADWLRPSRSKFSTELDDEIIKSNSRWCLEGQSESSPVATNSDAPSFLASSAFLLLRENAQTSAPSAFANMIAKWPKPPIPMTATFLPGPQPLSTSGEYVVVPAQSIGATSSVFKASGIGNTKYSWARMCDE